MATLLLNAAVLGLPSEEHRAQALSVVIELLSSPVAGSADQQDATLRGLVALGTLAHAGTSMRDLGRDMGAEALCKGLGEAEGASDMAKRASGEALRALRGM